MCQITDLYRYINDGGWRGCYRRVNAPASGRNHWRNDDVISSTRPAAHSLPAVLYNIYVPSHIGPPLLLQAYSPLLSLPTHEPISVRINHRPFMSSRHSFAQKLIKTKINNM
jgi:hypothetical protein